MTSCPKCSAQLKDDYGMVTCAGCGSIVFVDMDGLAQITSDESPESSVETPVSLEPLDVGGVPEFSSEPDLEPALEPAPSAEGGEIDMNAFLGYGTSGAESVESSQPMSQNDPSDPLGLSAYANSEMSAAKNGPLVVTLIISGIDAKDLRDEIREALQDSRFGWDVAALMSGIKGGTLRIEQVSPVKATIVINRIKNLSVQIRWEQSAITEIDPVRDA